MTLKAFEIKGSGVIKKFPHKYKHSHNIYYVKLCICVEKRHFPVDNPLSCDFYLDIDF